MQDGDLAAAAAMAAELRQRLGPVPAEYLQAHAAAVVGATTAIVAVRTGDLDLAMADLTRNYPLAVTTGDMPIMAASG